MRRSRPRRSGADPAEPVERYAFDLATPTPDTSANAPGGVDLANDPTPDLGDALTLEGVIPAEALASAEPIGDINGDGFDDLLVRGSDTAYVVFGPMNLADNTAVTDAAGLVLDLASLGRIVPSSGDLNGDGYADLAFVQDDSRLADVHVIFGGPDLPRTIDGTRAGVDPTLGRTGVTFRTDAGSEALILNHNGDAYDDLAVVGPFGGVVYDGQALSGGDFVQLSAFALDNTDRVQLVRETLGLSAATKVESFRQTITNSFDVELPSQPFGLDTIAFDPETGHLFIHEAEINSIVEVDPADGSVVNTLSPVPHMDNEGGIAITSAPMTLAGVDLPAYTLLIFLGNWISSGIDKQQVIAYDKFTGDVLATLNTDVPVVQVNNQYELTVSGTYDPLTQTLFAATSLGVIREIDPATGVTINSFQTPIDLSGAGGGIGSVVVGALRFDRVSGNLLVSASQPHLIIYEMTTDGQLVQTVDRPEFAAAGSGGTASPSFALDPYTGSAFVIVGAIYDATDIFKFSGFPRGSDIHAVVGGDINADGLDDLLITDSSFVRFVDGSGLDNIGRTYVLAGTTATGPRSLAADSDLIVQATRMAERASALGDVNGDGYDDFAISRSRENADTLDGGAFVFFGQPSAAAPGAAPVLDPAAEADVVVRRGDLDVLIPGESYGGELFVHAGDFNHDGQADLAVGAPTTTRVSSTGTVLQSSSRGAVYVYFDVQAAGGQLVLSDASSGPAEAANVVFAGVLSADELGTLGQAGPVDVNADGIDDLLIGSAGATASASGSVPAGGKIHVIYGSDIRHDLSGVDPVVIENSALGAFLVNRETGLAEHREGSLSPTTPEVWYRFTTLGDGFDSDTIRLSPGASGTYTLRPGSGHEAPRTFGGAGDASATLAFDLTIVADLLGSADALVDASSRLKSARPRRSARPWTSTCSSSRPGRSSPVSSTPSANWSSTRRTRSTPPSSRAIVG